MLVKLFYTCMCFLCNSRFKSSLELMLCVIDISTLNKTYYICHSESTILYSYSWMMRGNAPKGQTIFNEVIPRFMVGSAFLIFSVCCVFTCCVLCCDGRYDFRIKRCSIRLYLQLFVWGFMHNLRYLCFLLRIVVYVQHILCCVYALFVFVLCTLCCQFLWIVHFWLPLWYSLTFIHKASK